MAIQSLFGASPEELILARQREARQEQLLRNQQIAQQGQQFGVFAPLYQAGLRFGDIAGQAITQGLFPSSQDPMLKKAVDIQSVLSKYQGQDLNDPAVLTQIAGNLSGLGYANEAFSLAQTARASAREAERVNIERQRLGFEQKRVDLEGQRIGLEATRIREAQYKDNPELMLMEARNLPEDDPRKQALVNRYYDFKRDQQNRLAREAAELERINAQTAEARARAARDGELGIIGKAGPVGRAGAFRDVSGQIYGPADMAKQREAFRALGDMLEKINSITYADVKNAQSVFDYTQETGFIKGVAGSFDEKTVGAQTRIAAAQLLEQIDSLPPGSASDADMKAAKAAFPGYGSEANLLNWVNETKRRLARNYNDYADRFGFEKKVRATGALSRPKKSGEKQDEWSVINVQPSQ